MGSFKISERYNPKHRPHVIQELCEIYNQYHAHNPNNINYDITEILKWAENTIGVIGDLLEYHEGRI